VSSRLVARRYAKALLELAVKQDVLIPVQKELDAIQTLVRGNADLERLVSAPLIAPTLKASTFDAVLGAAGASTLVRRFFKVVTEAARLNHFHALVAGYHELVDAHLGIVEAHVTTAQPLSEAQTAALTETLTRRTGRTIRLKLRQEPSLLGGLQVQVGSTIYDASLRGQLAQLKSRLLSA